MQGGAVAVMRRMVTSYPTGRFEREIRLVRPCRFGGCCPTSPLQRTCRNLRAVSHIAAARQHLRRRVGTVLSRPPGGIVSNPCLKDLPMTLRNNLSTLWFAVITLLSAFLVFEVQPVISKTVLPWFGGSPAVWTTCMLFFQVVLFAGYAYAHLLNTMCSPRSQGLIQLVLIVAALLMLPITPNDDWKPTGTGNPTWQILLILGANVGLPYFLLSSTGPLVQAWFSATTAGQSPYRLYALSNIGSLAALFSYPIIVEPALTTTGQGAAWSVGFCLFALLGGWLSVGRWRSLPTQTLAVSQSSPPPAPPTAAHQVAWVLLPALASVALLATTNHVCQDIAVIPFLWVAPLALYLLSFIICFDRESWYARRWFAGGAALGAAAISALTNARQALPLVVEVMLYFVTLFLLCMVCHGELVRSKPAPRYLTKFYLLSSAGGALGGIFVALLCPRWFATFFEMNLCLIVGAALSMAVLCHDLRDGLLVRPQRKFIAGLTYFALFVFIGCVQTDQAKGNCVVARRNFYGALTVDLTNAYSGPGLSLLHGRVIHGFQFADPGRSHFPTTYYSPDSGVGLALRHFHQRESLRVGAVGLGAGTVSAYGRPGDYFRFYEINSAMVDVARDTFAFLSTCPARVDIEMGDARLTLEREPPCNFDVLILDAFSGDSIPTHLLTSEAFNLYRRHVKPQGIIAVHISNRHLKLEPVVLRQARELGLECVQIINRPIREHAVLPANWLLLTNNREFLARPNIAPRSRTFRMSTRVDFPLWTDRYNNLFQILNLE